MVAVARYNPATGRDIYIYIYIYIYIGRVYSIASYKITYFVATSIYDNFIY
jgi:hypothetical protein